MRVLLMKIVAVVHLATALGIVLFWIGFYTGLIFPVEEMKQLIPNFEGYYAMEKAFTIPDLLMAAVMVLGGLTLLKNPMSRLGRTLLIAASGAAVFLGVLDFNYAVSNGMYQLDHFFALLLMNVGGSMPLVGVGSVIVLHLFAPRQQAQ